MKKENIIICEKCGCIKGHEEISDFENIRCDSSAAINTVLNKDGGVLGSQCRACGATWYDAWYKE